MLNRYLDAVEHTGLSYKYSMIVFLIYLSLWVRLLWKRHFKETFHFHENPSGHICLCIWWLMKDWTKNLFLHQFWNIIMPFFIIFEDIIMPYMFITKWRCVMYLLMQVHFAPYVMSKGSQRHSRRRKHRFFHGLNKRAWIISWCFIACCCCMDPEFIVCFEFEGKNPSFLRSMRQEMEQCYNCHSTIKQWRN